MTPAAAVTGPTLGRRLLALALAGAALAGAAGVVFPQHAASLTVLAAAGVGLVVGVGVLAVAVVLDQRETPRTALDAAPSGTVEPLEPAGLRDARRDLGRRGADGALPPALWDRLAAGALVRFQRRGIDVAATRTRDEARALVDETTWAVLTNRTAPATRLSPVAAVHHVLDALDHLVADPSENQS